ncbi:MAG: Nudix family hydrolase [Gammaproteobacteria bacterium]|nr:Nudix family hydrolase [Gammaproteobacteria bacterium]
MRHIPVAPSGPTPNRPASAAVHVAVGLLFDRHRVFVTHRATDTHQGGKWEFPGGKCNPDEPVLAALERELHEELGIEVESAVPWMQVRHAYPDREVFLDVWQITAWRGNPRGREGQEARWCDIRNLPALDFPEADLPILRRLWLPPLYLISDAARFGKETFLEMLERALKAGARLIQLREPSMPQLEFGAYARTVAALCHRYGARLLLNADAKLVEECGADGVHLNSRRLMALDRRPLGNALFVAASCHNREELRQAVRLGVDFAVLSPVAATASHPGVVPLGWDKFRALCRSVPLPIYTLGGMRPVDLGLARDAGACGIATVSGIWGAADIEGEVAACADQVFPAADARAR